MTGPSSVLARLDSDEAAWARRHLADDVVGWLVTVSGDGRAQASPISFLWDGRTILFYSMPDTPKLRNIAANPKVAFHLNSDEYADHGLIVEGLATLDPSCPGLDVHPEYIAKYRAPLDHWELDEAKTARDFSVAVRITPTRIRAF